MKDLLYKTDLKKKKKHSLEINIQPLPSTSGWTLLCLLNDLAVLLTTLPFCYHFFPWHLKLRVQPYRVNCPGGTQPISHAFLLPPLPPLPPDYWCGAL